MRNWTEHGFSRLTAISDAGSTPAASTILPFGLPSPFLGRASRLSPISDELMRTCPVPLFCKILNRFYLRVDPLIVFHRTPDPAFPTVLDT